MSTELGAYIAAAAVVAVAAITLVARVAPPARSSEPAPFFEPEPGVRYLQCDELRCGHMTYPHRPQPGGTWLCVNCGTVKGGTS